MAQGKVKVKDNWKAAMVGASAPQLELPTLGGGRVCLEDLRGGPVLVSFLRHAG